MRFKKWLASLLVLCMILSLMPLTALANHAVFNDIYCSESVNLMNGWYEMTIQNQEGVNSENIPTYKFKPDPDVQHSINSIDPPLITVQTLAGTQTVETFPQIEEGAQIDLTVHPSSGYSIKFINALYTNLDKNINKQDMTNSSFEGFISYSNNGYTQELVFDMPSDVGDYFISIDPAFKKIPYNVTVDSNIEFGSVSASVTRTGGENEYSDFTLGSQAGINDIVTLTVTPDEGYVLDCLKYNNNEITAFGGVYSFTMPAGDVTVTAEFKADEHNYIHHPATVPEYNAVTGVYTDGNIDYYYCTECGKNFTYNPDTLTYSEYTGSLVVPYFEINDNGTYVRVMKYNGEDSEITVPDTVPDNYYKTELRGKNITSVNQSAFKNNEVIEKVTLGDNITHIGWEAFRGALSLEEVEIGSGLRTLDSFAFADCPSLEKFTCTATQGSITVTSYPFDEGAVRGVVFYGYHSGSFRTAVNKTSFNNHEDITYIGIDDHTAPNWSWSNDFSTATATFDCGNCDYASGPLNATVTSENVEDEFGVHREFTAEVTVDGITYSDTVNGGDFNVITYRVVNGAWSDGSTQDIIEYVPDGGAPEHIPTGMLPASGYEYGSWDGYPESIYEIYNDITFTYTFNPIEYKLWVGGVRVNPTNASDILGDGTAVYEGDSSSGTLTLTDAYITGSYIFLNMSGDYRLDAGIYASGIDLTICLEGENLVGMNNPYAGIVVGENGTLTFEGSGSLVSNGTTYGIWNILAGVTVNSGSVSGICNNGDGVSADTITVNGGSLTGEATGDNPNNDSIYSSEGFTFASGYGVVYPAGGQVGTDLNNHFVIQDENGETVTKAVLGDISVKYNLWVGGVRVDSANASDILGDGSAVYEGDSSSGTLTLTDAEITGSYVFLVMSGDYRLNTDIYVAGIDLTICLVGDSTVGTDNPYAGIVVGVNGTLTFEGSGSLVSSGRIYGIWNDLAGITVNSGSVSGICNNGDGVSADTITVNGGSLTGEATGDNPNNDSIYSSEGFTFASGYGVVYPAGGQVGTDLNNHFVIQDENGETVTKAVLGELPRIPVTVEFGANHGDYAADNFGTLDGVTVNGTQITYYVPAGTTVTSARGAFMDMLLYYNETIGISLPRDIPKYDAGEYFMRDVALNPASEYTESSFYDELTGDYYKTEIPAEGILFYAQWAQPAGMVEVTVIPPVVGTEIGVSGTGALVRSNPPVEAAVTGNAVLDTHSARNWTNSDFSGYYSGTVTEGQLCYAGFNVNPAYGYYFYVMDDNGDVQFANGTSVIVKNDSNATFTPIDTLEGVKIKATVKAVDPVIFVGAHSLSLDGDIGVNFYASIPGVTDAAYAEFTVDSETVIVPVALNKTAVQDGVTLYKFTCRVHSPQIDTPITGKIVNGSSESETFTYSVQEYLTEAQQTMADNTKFMALASALATYGYNANELFDYNPDFTQHNLYDDRGFAAVNASALADYAADFTNSEGGVDYYGSSLVLRTKTAIRHYFTLPEGRTIDDYTFVLGEGENAVELKPVAKGSLYFIEISNVGSGDLGKAYTVTVYESGTVVNTWTYSALSYVYQVLALYEAGDSSFTEELANTVKALALYYQAADAYFSEINP